MVQLNGYGPKERIVFSIDDGIEFWVGTIEKIIQNEPEKRLLIKYDDGSSSSISASVIRGRAKPDIQCLEPFYEENLPSILNND